MIRAFTPFDRDAVREILRTTQSFNPSELAIADELIDAIINVPGQSDYHAFVGLSDERQNSVAGFLIVGPTPATVGTWHLYWIAVHPASQGKGLAARLQEHAEAYVRSRGGYWLLAETSGQLSYARSRAFYFKQGYKELARIPDYYRPADDMIIFGKRLPARSDNPATRERT
jgi:ribosomal protein S18 acetylase RimI-like enzyme